jgi:hypothetical protein
MLPFTRDQFLDVFVAYNGVTLPEQVLAYLLGAACLYAVARPSNRGDLFAAAGLGVMWVWTGAVYHAIFFSRINPIAMVFGLGFVLQGLWIIWEGYKGRLAFGAVGDAAAYVGWGLIGYAVVLYPIFGFLSGYSYLEMPMFGITPCPLVLFTLGMFLLTRQPLPYRLLILPVIWSLIGGSAAFLLGIVQDWPLLFSGGLAVLAILIRCRLHSDRATTAT